MNQRKLIKFVKNVPPIVVRILFTLMISLEHAHSVTLKQNVRMHGMNTGQAHLDMIVPTGRHLSEKCSFKIKRLKKHTHQK